MEQFIEKNFRIGFNHGYWLAKAGGNELSDLLATQNPKTSDYKGLASGKREWEKEKIIEKNRSQGRSNRDNDHS